MKSGFIFLATLFALHFSGYAQSTTWNWSVTNCVLTTSSDSAFLVDTEKEMWAVEKKTNAFTVYEGFNDGWGYNVRMSKWSMEHAFEDTMIAKLKFTNTAQLLTLWNNSADTCWLIGFEPLVTFERNHRWYLEKDWKYNTCYVHIPLFTYQSHLKKQEMSRLTNMAIDGLTNEFGATRSGDTLFRTITFIDDSNNYLPQARYSHMGGMMKNGMLAGSLSVYSDQKLHTRLSKAALERAFVYWDSTNSVEDPNNPGVFILAPLKIEAQAIGVVIYEKWIPALCPYENYNRYPLYRPQPYMSFGREVMAYGLLLSSGKILWIPPQQFDIFFRWPGFYRSPYDESFRAERFSRMHLELYPY